MSPDSASCSARAGIGSAGATGSRSAVGGPTTATGPSGAGERLGLASESDMTATRRRGRDRDGSSMTCVSACSIGTSAGRFGVVAAQQPRLDLLEPRRHPVNRRSADDEGTERGQQCQKRDRQPRGDGGDQRRGRRGSRAGRRRCASRLPRPGAPPSLGRCAIPRARREISAPQPTSSRPTGTLRSGCRSSRQASATSPIGHQPVERAGDSLDDRADGSTDRSAQPPPGDRGDQDRRTPISSRPRPSRRCAVSRSRAAFAPARAIRPVSRDTPIHRPRATAARPSQMPRTIAAHRLERGPGRWPQRTNDWTGSGGRTTALGGPSGRGRPPA